MTQTADTPNSAPAQPGPIETKIAAIAHDANVATSAVEAVMVALNLGGIDSTELLRNYKSADERARTSSFSSQD